MSMSSMSMPSSSMSSMSIPSSSMSSMSTTSSSMSSMSMSSSSVSSMSMISSSMSSMSMAMSAMGTTSSSMSSMSMTSTTVTMSSSMSTGMSGMDMGSNSSDTSMDMSMNYYLTPTFKNYPVLFHKLSANSSGKAFGIFLLIVVAAFVYKFLLFISWCLEVHWFKKWNKTNKYSTTQIEKAVGEKSGVDYYSDEPFQIQTLPKIPNFVFDVFSPSLIDLFHDLIRAFLTFTSTMIIYMLMLASMSFVLTYVFAVITGLALAEVFFNRCKICMLKRWDIQREIQRTLSCAGAADCQCGRHQSDDEIATAASNDQSTRLQDKESSGGDFGAHIGKGTEPPSCCCTEKTKKQERRMELDILESSKLQEQAGNMDANLLPAEKFS